MVGDPSTIYPPPSKKMRLNHAEQIQVIVGEEKQLFSVHKHEICSRSEFFKAACSERWTKPGETRTIELFDDCPYVFDIYLRCVYKARVDIGDVDESITGECGGEDFCGFEKEHRLAKAFILAEKLQDSVAANLIIDEMIRICVQLGFSFYDSLVALVANNSTKESCMRKLIIDILINAEHLGVIKELCELESVPRDFIGDMLIKQSDLFTMDRALIPTFWKKSRIAITTNILFSIRSAAKAVRRTMGKRREAVLKKVMKRETQVRTKTPSRCFQQANEELCEGSRLNIRQQTIGGDGVSREKEISMASGLNLQ